MGIFDVTNTFSAGTKAKASEVNTNFGDTINTALLVSALRKYFGKAQYVHPFSLAAGTSSVDSGNVYLLKSLTMSGGTLTVTHDTCSSSTVSVQLPTAHFPVVFIVDGDVSITSGTIDFKGQGYAGGAGGLGGGSPHSGVSGKGCEVKCGYAAGTTGGGGGAVGTPGGGASGSASNGTAGSGGGGAAGVYTAFSAAEIPDDFYNALNIFSGAGGGGGGGTTSYDGAPGGDGGLSLIIICSGNLIFTGGTIDVRGNAGSSGFDKSGGGGAGGDILFLYHGTYTSGGTTLCTGGAGGSPGGGSGGNGQLRAASF